MSTAETVTHGEDQALGSGFTVEFSDVKRFKRILLAMKKAANITEDGSEKYLVRMEVLRSGLLFRGEIRDRDGTECLSVEFFISREVCDRFDRVHTLPERVFTFDLEDVYAVLKGRSCGGIQRVEIVNGEFKLYGRRDTALIEYEVVDA